MSKRPSWPELIQRKAQGEPPWAVLTAYDATTAKLLDRAEIDVILVGDSLAMTALGYEDTLSVTLDEMLHHTKAVRRGAKRSLILADAPFMSYTIGVEETLRKLSRFVKEAGADAVKVEGASPIVLEGIQRLGECGIPVVGHVGLAPQHIKQVGGFKKQGKTQLEAERILNEAKAVEAAGAVAVVVEVVPAALAKQITESLSIPTIGIGSGPHCDAQVIVTDDLLGRYPDFRPTFVQPLANLAEVTQTAAEQFKAAVAKKDYPG